MPKYFYKAKSLKGEEKSGVLEAEDTRGLAKKLHAQGFILIKAEPEETLKKRRFEIFPALSRVSLTEKIFFTRNLQVMISAGLTLPKALGILALQAKSEKFKTALSNIREEIVKGKSLSESLTRYPDIFTELFQSMIKVGEETGSLEEVLKTLTLQMEKVHNLRSKIKGAMIYPTVVVCAMIGVGVLMLIMVVPQLAETFEELNVELPIATKVVIGFATFLAQKWYLALVVLFFLIILIWQSLKIKAMKKIIDKVVLKIPIMAPIIKNTNSAYTVRTLSSLIAAGTPLPRSLEITSETLGNIYYKKAMAEGAEKVRKGEKLSETLKPYGNIYPQTIIQMVAVGEETGKTSDVLAKLADYFEDEVSNATKNLASVIEPILMIIIGVVIGFFAVSMIQPMYSMLEAI
ncbi:MAG: type II secretion system F family protein [Candidatus Paceibacterales bacterium]